MHRLMNIFLVTNERLMRTCQVVENCNIAFHAIHVRGAKKRLRGNRSAKRPSSKRNFFFQNFPRIFWSILYDRSDLIGSLVIA